ncbi:MAG: gliding motility-associated C-terminal domain-containing protein, partial [Bacteroidetes bacterium]|nr:gliding motility-associated C-terminal domain-containing protein [Bacteroidota bacterium]
FDAASCSDCNNPNLTVNETMAVYVTVSEAANSGCFATDSVVIIVSGGVKMPNAFTPNGDGKNDRFGIVPMPNTRMVEMRIYNRWGAQVYNGVDGWDGTANGKEQAPGTFIYYVQVETPDTDNPGQMKTVSQQGSFTLLR